MGREEEKVAGGETVGKEDLTEGRKKSRIEGILKIYRQDIVAVMIRSFIKKNVVYNGTFVWETVVSATISVLYRKGTKGEDMEEKKYAVIIDADNVSPKYIKFILEEVSDMGIASYKRIYGDWTDQSKKSWKQELLNNSFTPVQQYTYTSGKNATDSAMIIDAMDILYTGHVQGFCLVSSDSDFTKLASRLRESGMHVVGMGEKKTPDAFRRACDVFRILDVIAYAKNGAVEKQSNTAPVVEVTDLQVITDAILDMITMNNNQGKQTNMGEVGSTLNKKFPEFDVRNYGYTKLSTFLESMDQLQVIKEGSSYSVQEKTTGPTKEELETCMKDQILENNGKIDNMSILHDEIRKKYPNFQIKNYGFSRFSSFVRSFTNFKVEDNMVSMKKGKKK